MIHFPKLLHEESLYSLTGRIARINGFGDHLGVCKMLLGDELATSVADCHVNFEHLSGVSNMVYGSPRQLLDRLTMYLILRHLGMDLTVTYGISSSGIRMDAGDSCSGLLFLSMGALPRWRICGQCRERDIRRYGISYWHREHMLPTSLYCPEHGTRLIEKDLPRRLLHDHLWLPDEAPDLPESKVSLEGPDVNRMWLDIAMLGKDALTDLSEPHPEHAIRSAFLVGMRQKALLKSNGKICLSAYLQGYVREFHEVYTLAEPRYLLRGLTDNRPGNPMLRLLLVHWFFGSWQLFIDRCLWENVMGNGFETLELKPAHLRSESDDIKALTVKYRQVCLDYKKCNPQATRLDFLRSSYRVFNWLLQHDRAWLGDQLPLPGSGSRQKELFE